MSAWIRPIKPRLRQDAGVGVMRVRVFSALTLTRCKKGHPVMTNTTVELEALLMQRSFTDPASMPCMTTDCSSSTSDNFSDVAG